MIFIELVLEASAEGRDELVELARRTTAATQREDGCVLYRFSTDVEQPLRFVLTELWDDEEALKAHFKGAPFKNFFAELPSGTRFVGNRAWEGPLAPYSPPDPGIRPPQRT